MPTRAATDRRTPPIRRLYFSHLLAQFGDRLWQFAIPVLFITVWKDTVLPSAIFEFLLSAIRIVLVPMVGRRVDTTDRLKLVRFGTFGQNGCIFVSGALLLVLFQSVMPGDAFGDNLGCTILFAMLIVVGIVGDLFNIAGKLGVEKDWVVVIVDEEVSRGDTVAREDRLADLNSKLRRIDLLCKILAPLSFGLLTGWSETRQGEVIIGTGIVCGWSLLSTFPIYWAWRSVYDEYTQLQSVKPKKKQNPFSVLRHAGAAYIRHPVFAPSLAFCCLFFTVLSDHHPLSTAFLKMDGVSNLVLGAARGGGAFTGILGTMIFPLLRSYLGLVGANIVEAWAFVLCIVPTALQYIESPSEIPGDDAPRAHFLLFGIVLSRLFLWGFDLANTQLMQEMVNADTRGEINGMQAATCNIMELVMSSLALLCTSHGSFRVLVFASGGGVTCAAVILTIWAWTRRPEPAALTPTLISD